MDPPRCTNPPINSQCQSSLTGWLYKNKYYLPPRVSSEPHKHYTGCNSLLLYPHTAVNSLQLCLSHADSGTPTLYADLQSTLQHVFCQSRRPPAITYHSPHSTSSVYARLKRFTPTLTSSHSFLSCQKLSYRRHDAPCITNSTNFRKPL